MLLFKLVYYTRRLPVWKKLCLRTSPKPIVALFDIQYIQHVHDSICLCLSPYFLFFLHFLQQFRVISKIFSAGWRLLFQRTSFTHSFALSSRLFSSLHFFSRTFLPSCTSQMFYPAHFSSQNPLELARGPSCSSVLPSPSLHPFFPYFLQCGFYRYCFLYCTCNVLLLFS